MELSKEVHGLLDRIKRLSNAQKPNVEDSYNFSMKTSYSRLDDVEFTNDDLIPIEEIDFSDKETWLYVSEESSTNTESSDFLVPDMTRLSEGDCIEYDNDRLKMKNVDTRTFTRPKKRVFNRILENRNRDHEIGNQINQTKQKINGICEELSHIEQIKIPENPFKDANLEKDGSISTGPLHFKLSDPILNDHSFNKILLTASDGYDSFINMSPPSLMNSLCSSSFMDTSLIQNTSNPTLVASEKSDSFISTEVSQESLSEFLSPLKTSWFGSPKSDTTLTKIDKTFTETPLSKGNLTSTPLRPNATPKKLNLLNSTFNQNLSGSEEKNEANLENSDKFFDADNENFDIKKGNIDIFGLRKNKFNKNDTFEAKNKIFEAENDNFGAKNETFEAKNENFRAENDLGVQNKTFEAINKNFSPEIKNLCSKTEYFDSENNDFCPESQNFGPEGLNNLSRPSLDATFKSNPNRNQNFDRPKFEPKISKMFDNLDTTFDTTQKPKIIDETFTEPTEKQKSPSSKLQNLGRLATKEVKVQNVDMSKPKFESKLMKFGSRGSETTRSVEKITVETNFDEVFDDGEDFMKNEHKKLLDATFDTKNIDSKTITRPSLSSKLETRRSSLRNDENKSLNSTFTNLYKGRSTEKSLNSTFVQLNKTDSDSDLNSTFTKNKLNTFTKKARNITNLPESFKMSCPDINKSFQSQLLEKSLNRTYQKLSDSQPNLTKNGQSNLIMNQTLELRNSNAYDGYKNRCGSTDSLDDKSSSISNSSKESTSKILNIGDLDNLARLQEQSLHQVMSTPKPKTAMTRFWDSEVMSPIPRTEEYLSEDSDFTDFSDQCVTARSRSSRPSTASSGGSRFDTFKKPTSTVPKQEIRKPVPAGFVKSQQQTNVKNVPTMVVKPLEVTRTIKTAETKSAAQENQTVDPNRPRIRPSGLPRPTSALQTGIPRPVSRIPAPRFNRPQLTRPASKPIKKSDWMDGCY